MWLGSTGRAAECNSVRVLGLSPGQAAQFLHPVTSLYTKLTCDFTTHFIFGY